eukprot:m.334086 g.334086  ORF g.334086 m.334086 type:complete len:357 (-) comp17284_c0_seq1:154-1224(-)
MSHQSGIQGSEELQEALSQSIGAAGIRLVKIQIISEGETILLQPTKTVESSGDLESDYDNAMNEAISEDDENKCCFMIVRLETQNANGYDWLFISYAPDYADVRDKMIYASTRATLKTFIGVTYLKEEMFGTTRDDISYEGYKRHLESEAAPPPLSMEEMEKAEIKAMEVGVDIGASTKKSLTATGVYFPVSDEGLEKLKAFKNGDVNFVQLSLDIPSESINLENSGDMTVDEAAKLVPAEAARYQLFNFKHAFEGEQLESVLFVYSCPGFKLKVQDRMLYASCKAPLLDIIEQDIGITITKKLEIDDGTEFSHEEFYNTLHPVKQVHTMKFARPKGPAGRKGSSRLTSRTVKPSS